MEKEHSTSIAVLYKFPHRGYSPIAFTCLLLTMHIYMELRVPKYYYEMENKVSPDTLKEILSHNNFGRILGMAIFYSELVHGVLPIFEHYVVNVPALQLVVVFASVKALPVSTVPSKECFVFHRVHPRKLYLFRCVVR
ncbi:hypothetical protein RND81_11G023100 [Saponaria officinalis]|uniref:K+ potassium transporter C-terminal domain-containing protein n=1 Tax=Saponaria officinalis TaxID=3572 RepID=A0AAW1HH36_SAPOF